MSQQKSFWQTGAGTVAAVAAMVTALAGAIPVIMAIRGGNDKPSGAASPTPTATVTGTPTEASPGGQDHAPDVGSAPPVIASPKSLDFGKVAPSLTSSQVVQLVNTGQDPVTVERIRVVGPASASFTISEGTCTEGGEVAPDAACDVKIRFGPSGSGPQQATLVVERNPGAPVEVPLSGTAGLL